MVVQRTSRMRVVFRQAVLVAVAIHIWGAAASAGPEGAAVVQGTAQFDQSGNYTAIRVSDKAIINYTSFDIARPETVEFIQPGASASVLNRILSATPTVIDGTVLANGRVFFVNPAGVLFGESAQVNVTQLVASALNISDADFTNGRYDFQGGQGEVINRGSLSAEQVALIGKRVANLGKIDCPGGTVVLVAGDRVFLGEPGTDLLVEIDPSVLSDNAEPIEGSGVLNEGTVEVGGGSIVLAAAGDVYSRAISNVGKLSASTADGDAGTVELAAPDGTVINTGSITATSESGKGGNVQVVGDRVGLFEDGEIDVSGAGGGGTALVGGDYQGRGEVPTASRTVVGPDAVIWADATEDGEGGKVVVWSDEVTKFYGHASAIGAGDGDGGLIEVSGKQDLNFVGTAALGSPGGRGGTLLLDPVIIRVTDGGQDQSPQSDLSFNDQPSYPTISEVTLENTASGSNAQIVLEASNDIVIDDLTDNALTLSNGVSLVLRTRNNPAFEENPDGGITMNQGDSIVTSGGGSITLQAGHDGQGFVANSAGVIFAGSLVTDGGSVTVQATGEVSVRNITTGGADNNVALEASRLTASHMLPIDGTRGGEVSDGVLAEPTLLVSLVELKDRGLIREAESIVGSMAPPQPECLEVKDDDIEALRKCQVACNLFSTDVSLVPVAQDVVSLDNRLKARIQDIIPLLESLSQRWPQPRPGDIPVIEQAIKNQGTVLTSWLHDGAELVKLQRKKLGRTTNDSIAQFVLRYPASATQKPSILRFVRLYLLALTATGSEPVA